MGLGVVFAIGAVGALAATSLDYIDTGKQKSYGLPTGLALPAACLWWFLASVASSERWRRASNRSFHSCGSRNGWECGCSIAGCTVLHG